MTGYSKTPLIKKLGIKENTKILFYQSPEHFYHLLGEFPSSVILETEISGKYDYIHFFVSSKKEMQMNLKKMKAALITSGMIWISWPKKSSKVPTDITEDTIREICLPLDLVDIKVCAVDEIWSGLKLVIRKNKR